MAHRATVTHLSSVIANIVWRIQKHEQAYRIHNISIVGWKCYTRGIAVQEFEDFSITRRLFIDDNPPVYSFLLMII